MELSHRTRSYIALGITALTIVVVFSNPPALLVHALTFLARSFIFSFLGQSALTAVCVLTSCALSIGLQKGLMKLFDIFLGESTPETYDTAFIIRALNSHDSTQQITDALTTANQSVYQGVIPRTTSIGAEQPGNSSIWFLSTNSLNTQGHLGTHPTGGEYFVIGSESSESSASTASI